MYALWWHLACRIGCCRGVSSPALAFKVVCVHVFRGDKNDSSVCMYIAWRADYDPHVHVPVACTPGDPAYNTTSLTLPPPSPARPSTCACGKCRNPAPPFSTQGPRGHFVAHHVVVRQFVTNGKSLPIHLCHSVPSPY